MSHASREKPKLSEIAIIDPVAKDEITSDIDIDAAVENYLNENPPTGGLTLDQIKADTTIADAISKKHSNTTDHALGSDNQDLSGLQPKESGKGLSANDYTTAEQTKLSGLSNYSHPANHAPSIITQDVSNRFVSDSEKSTWNGKSNLVLGDLAANAYYGDKGKTAYDHSQASHAPAGAEVNVNADWNASSGDAQIMNKPTISGSNTGDETAARIATIITGAAAQTTPLDADEFPFYKIVGTILSKVTWANIKATLKVVEDLLYNPKRLFTNLAASVVTSGTTEKILIQLAIPAARAVVGSTFRAWVVGNSSSTGTLIFKVRCGAGGVITDAIGWTAVTSAAQAANARAGFEVLITVRSATTLYTDGVGYAGAVQLPTYVAAPATSVIAISGIWYINLTVICSSGTFTAQVGSIEEIR
jgi:hypothetical protein